MTIALYPGSFDPITNGHLDIIERAARMYDRLIIGVLKNSLKEPLFTAEERTKLISNVVKHINNVEVTAFDGLLIDFAHNNNIHVIVRGLRAVTDFEYELQIAQTNKVLAPDLDTVFLTTSLQYSYLSPSIVKEIASYDGDISAFVNEQTALNIKKKMKDMR